jgi:lipoprotein-anchoring transpeptidase ErfK/SrfK
VKTSIRITIGAVALAAALAPMLTRSPQAVVARPASADVPATTPTGDGEAEVPPASPVTEALNPDPEHPSGDVIEVSIDRQRLIAWRDGVAEYLFTVSTGRPGYETPTGHFRIRAKYLKGWSRKWQVVMPYTLNFFQNYNFHELPHRPGSKVRIGASRLGTPDSHGCVRVGVGDAKLLYEWARVGTPVWIH